VCADPTDTSAGRCSRSNRPRKSQRLVADFSATAISGDGVACPTLQRSAHVYEMTARMMADPARLVEAQMSLWNDLCDAVAAHHPAPLGQCAKPVIED